MAADGRRSSGNRGTINPHLNWGVPSNAADTDWPGHGGQGVSSLFDGPSNTSPARRNGSTLEKAPIAERWWATDKGGGRRGAIPAWARDNVPFPHARLSGDDYGKVARARGSLWITSKSLSTTFNYDGGHVLLPRAGAVCSWTMALEIPAGGTTCAGWLAVPPRPKPRTPNLTWENFSSLP